MDPILVDTTDGDTFLEPGETGTVDVPVTNDGDATALLVNTELQSSTPGVTIQPATHDYGNIDIRATRCGRSRSPRRRRRSLARWSR